MDTHLIIDIETVASDRAKEYVAGKNFQAPETYKSPEAILRYVEKAKNKALDRAALKSWTAKVICIGYQLMDSLTWKPEKPCCFYGDDESILLEQFAEKIVELEIEEQRSIYLWGYNSLDFDFPFLYDRYRALDKGVPAILNQRFRLKDVKTVGRIGSKSSMAAPLDDQLFGIGIPGKTGSGNMVAAWYGEEQWDKITSYCMDDVAKTTELLRRSRPYKGIDIYQG